jgi:glycosyltransferase involved in cell wall biosynthesis
MVVSVSTATGEDVERIVGGPAQNRRVILNGLNHPYGQISREEAMGRLSQASQLKPETPFVLHVGSNLSRKNRMGVIRAFALASREVDLQLVLVGPQLTPQLQEVIVAEGVGERVTVIVKPGNEVLEALYNVALALFFPSRYEGFGWPLIEAQACGCPVICSRCGPFPEVMGTSAIVRDVDDERGFAGDIVRLAEEAPAREACIAAGLENARRFDQERMVAGYLDVYRELAGRQ